MSDSNETKLDQLTEKLEKGTEKQSFGMVSFTDLFTPEFMSAHTQFANFGELLVVGKYNVNSLHDFLALLNDEFDVFIKKNTKFKNWEEMQSTAVAEYFKKKEGSK